MASVRIYQPDEDTPFIQQLEAEDTRLQQLQRLVGGSIQIFPHPTDSNYALVMDEEGRLKNKPKNLMFPGHVGTLLVIEKKYL